MRPWNAESQGECRDVQSLLSDYIDNTLSARQVWAVEKHLAACASCAETARQMQATVQLLHAAPRHDTGDDFMARLHARLDGLEPDPTPVRSLWDALRDGLADLSAGMKRNRVPALSLGFAAVALAVLVSTQRPSQVNNPAPAQLPPINTEAIHIPVAASANNPFSDPAAENLEDRSAQEPEKASTPF